MQAGTDDPSIIAYSDAVGDVVYDPAAGEIAFKDISVNQ